MAQATEDQINELVIWKKTSKHLLLNIRDGSMEVDTEVEFQM